MIMENPDDDLFVYQEDEIEQIFGNLEIEEGEEEYDE